MLQQRASYKYPNNRRPQHFDKELEATLDATGLPWRIEAGSNHDKILLAGRFVGIVARCFKTGSKNMVKKDAKRIARIAAEIKGEGNRA